MNKMNKYFYTDENNTYINTPYAEAYIYADLFDDAEKDPSKSSIAYLIGESVHTIGNFYMRFFEANNENYHRESAQLFTLNYPNMIAMEPSSISSKTELEINGKRDKYVILTFEKGDVLMRSSSEKAASNVEKFVRMALNGKIPDALDYNAFYHAWIKNGNINAFDPGTPDVTIQAIISEICRNPSNYVEQFRRVAGKGPIDLYSYVILNMNTVSAYSSVVSSLAFERFSEKLTTSINMTKSNTPQKPTPIESVLIM